MTDDGLIDYGDRLLTEWGIYSAKGGDGAIGYPSVCPTFRPDGGGGSGSSPNIPIGVFETDRVVAELKVGDFETFDAVRLWYGRGIPKSSIARIHRCTERTIRNRIYRACAYVGARRTGLINAPEINTRSHAE